LDKTLPFQMRSTKQAEIFDHFIKCFAFECKLSGKEDSAYGLKEVSSQHFAVSVKSVLFIVIHLFKLKNCEVKK